MTTEAIPDLEIKLGDGYPAVRGGWVRGFTQSKALGLAPSPIEGEIRRIERETDGAHAGRVLLVIYEPNRGHERLVMPQNCTSRKPPGEGTLKRSRAKIHAASEAEAAKPKTRRRARRK